MSEILKKYSQRTFFVFYTLVLSIIGPNVIFNRIIGLWTVGTWLVRYLGQGIYKFQKVKFFKLRLVSLAVFSRRITIQTHSM